MRPGRDLALLVAAKPIHSAVWLGVLLLTLSRSLVLGDRRVWAYLIVCLVLTAVVAAVDRTVGFTDGVLWALLGVGALHLACGLLPNLDGRGVLYDAWLVPGALRVDQAVHALGSAAGTWASWQLLGTWLDLSRAPARTQGVLAALAGLGKGAVNEALEFLAALQGGGIFVGGFENTGWDLVFDIAGCAACAVLLTVSGAERRPVPACCQPGVPPQAQQSLGSVLPVTADDPRRRVPRTDVVLADPRLISAATRFGVDVVKSAVVAAQQRARAGDITPEQVVEASVAGLPVRTTTLRPVLNATGVVLHTNLGRAPLSAAAVEAIATAAAYVDVEYDVADGSRARRGRGTLAALREAVPDAEDVLVVNNGAAALVLATTALATGREVVVSRGEMVEIGDGFRLPDLIASTGARLREVGTTNRTHLRDYAGAVGPDTGCVLKVHPSNFRVEGFTSEVAVAELAGLGAPVVVDIGSGLFAPHPLLPGEPDARTALRAGAALVTASGDKLLGGPQAGLLLGRRDVVERLRRHPLARALRVDKLTLAALEATVRGPQTPTWRALGADVDSLRARCEQLAAEVGGEVVPSDGAVGGGGAPGLALPGWAVALPVACAEALRRATPCVVGRVERGRCLLDLRCVPEADDARLAEAVRAAGRACMS